MRSIASFARECRDASGMMEAPLVEARCLDKIFGSSPVLRGLDLRVIGGAGAMIIGRNGAGKSTLLRTLAGLTRPSAGEALLFGRPSTDLPSNLRARIALVTHQSFLYPTLSARENLEFVAALYRVEDGRADVDGWLDRVGLRAVADERVRTFSRGMEQRLALARALLPQPDILLMDEPFAALDGDGVALVIDLVREALARCSAIVIAAHEPLALDGFSFYELVRGRLARPVNELSRENLRPFGA